MRYPQFLKEGGTIGVIAPSFGCTFDPYAARLDHAIHRFQKWGYSVKEGENVRLAEGVGKSNTPLKCAEEINRFFLEEDCDVILSAGGGETMCEDLSYVDFEAIRLARPKWFMGFSDNTNLTFTLPVLCDTAAIYGPCAPSFGCKPMHKSIKDARKILEGRKLKVKSYKKWEREGKKEETDPLASYHLSEPFSMMIVNDEDGEASFSGRLIGGCLDCLITLCGTSFDKVKEFNEKYQEDGIIWFLEACDLNPMSIRRALWQLKNAGWFEHVNGFMIGRSLHFDEEIMGVDRLNAYTDALKELGVPILLDLDLGHLPPSMPLIAGALATVKASVRGKNDKPVLSVEMSLE